MGNHFGGADSHGGSGDEVRKPDADADDARPEQASPEGEGRPAARLRMYTLPNGMEIAYQSRVEIEHFFEDIFEKQIYVKNGISLAPGDCVFDVGANIGFFTMFVHTHFKGIETYSFEPAPPLFEILSANVALHAPKANLFNCGISDAERTAKFTFYPNSSGMSSFYADLREEKEVLRSIMLNQTRKGMAGMEQLMKHADDLLEERFRSSDYECRLTTLSSVIREQGVKKIDLLKIDVQKSELDVLRGIAEEDWGRIRQIVIEVHDIGGRLETISALLAGRGFGLAVEQDDMYEGSPMYNIYAVRRGEERAGDPAAFRQLQDRAKKYGDALNRQRQLINQRRKDK